MTPSLSAKFFLYFSEHFVRISRARILSATASVNAEMLRTSVHDHPLFTVHEQRRVAGMIEDIMTVRMTEAELARDVHAVLEKVRQGVEVVIEQGNRPVAVLKAHQGSGRQISDVIAALEADGASAVLDEDFARDVEDGIKSHREPWHPPSWD